MSDCKRGCCWNNWGVCGKYRNCRCHVTQAQKDAALQDLRDQQWLRDEAAYAAKHPTYSQGA